MTIGVSTNIQTEKQAQAAMIDTLKNPPRNPVQAFSWLTKNVNFSAAFGKTIGGLIPGVGSVIGSLTDIFSAFSSAPSLGEIVLDGLKSLSSQISELKNELTLAIEKTAEMQTARTVDFVLQGVDEIQREASAIQVMQSMSDEAALQQVAGQKAQIYTEYLAELNDMQAKAYTDIKSVIDGCEAELQKIYAEITLRFGGIGLDFFKYLESLTQKAPAVIVTTRSASAAPGVVKPTEEIPVEKPFPWLYLSPLALLLFMGKKK